MRCVVNHPGTRSFAEADATVDFVAPRTIDPAARAQRQSRSVGEAADGATSAWTKRPSSAFVSARTLPVIGPSLEFGIVALAAFGACALYHKLVFGQLPVTGLYLPATLLLTGLFILPCAFRRDYSLKRLLLPKEQLQSVFLHWNSAYSLFVFVLFMTHATEFYSRGSIITQYAAGFLTAIAVRLLMTRLVAQGLRKGRLGGKRALVVGEASTACEFARRLQTNTQGVDVVRVVTLPAPDSGAAGEPDQTEKEIRAALDTIEGIARTTEIDDIVISLPWSESSRIRAFTEGLAVVPATIHLAPDRAAAWTQAAVLARVGSLETIRLSRAPLTLRDRILKRIFDLVVASALVVALIPVFAVIAVLIKRESAGPVLFRQRRHGFNQSEFRIFKFRSMTTVEDGAVIRQATRDDPRTTRVGRVLRRYNLDELPQLLNVLAGEMSLVGPRPHAVAHNNEYEEKIRLYARRHNVKPGITGWSQVKGYRGQTDSIDKMRRRVEHDLYYIDNWSILFDVKILLMTIFSPEVYRNAY